MTPDTPPARPDARPIAAILFLTVVLCAFGAWSLFFFPVSILPDVTFPRIVLIAEAGERPVRRMEAGVVRPLEEAIATIPGVARVRTKIERGAAETSIDFAWGTNMIVAEQLVNTKANEVRPQLPPETVIHVERMNPTVFPVYGLSLRSQKLSPTELWNLATYTIRPRLSRVPGVARVVVQGGRVPEIAVNVDPRRLRAFNLSLPDVTAALTQTNITRAVGRIDERFQQNQIFVSGETTDPAQLGDIVVVERNGVPVMLRQIAEIRPSAEDQTTIVTADGKPAVLLNIVRQPEANTMAVVEAVKKELAALKPTLPPGTETGGFYDQTVLIREAIASVRDAVLIGAVLAVVVLMLFLGDWRATLVTAAIIPATVLITFLLMRLSGLTINLMTLGALAVGIGLVIDDAIVVVENIFRHLARGETRTDAIRLASREIAAPMISSTLTTVVVFLPLAFLSGVAGAFFTALAVTLTISLMVSLALALYVSPSLCVAFLSVQPGAREHGRLFERVLHLYDTTLRGLMRRRWLLPVGATAILAATYFFASRLGTGFMPSMDEGAFVLDFTTPPGTSLNESYRILSKIEDILKDTPEVDNFTLRIGTELGFALTETNRGDFTVTLKPNRKKNIEQVMEDIRGRVEGEAHGAETEYIQALQDLIGDLSGAPAPVEIKLFGSDQAQLGASAKQVSEKLGKIPGVVDVVSGVVETGPEITVQVDPLRSGRVGLTSDAVATQANAAMFGDVATELLLGDRQVGVRVRFPENDRRDLTQLSLLPIRAPGGFTLPLRSLGTIETSPGSTNIDHEDQRRTISVTAGLSDRDLGSVQRDVQTMLRGTTLPAGVTHVLGGQFQSQDEAFRNLLTVLAMAILLVFAVMIFQFGSFTAPLTILLIMPLSLFGAAFALWATGTPLNVSSFMGGVMLVGIVVKNGILLLDWTRQAERQGMSVEEAAVRAGEARLRPILMTTLTAILGLLPLAFGLGAGAEMQKPLAIAVIGGLTFSTLFTLLFAPLLYVTLRRAPTGNPRP